MVASPARSSSAVAARTSVAVALRSSAMKVEGSARCSGRRRVQRWSWSRRRWSEVVDGELEAADGVGDQRRWQSGGFAAQASCWEGVVEGGDHDGGGCGSRGGRRRALGHQWCGGGARLRREITGEARGFGEGKGWERVEGRSIYRGKRLGAGGGSEDRDPEKFGIPAAAMPCVACGRRKKGAGGAIGQWDPAVSGTGRARRERATEAKGLRACAWLLG